MSIYRNGKLRAWLNKWGLVAFMLLVFSTFTVSSQDDRRARRLRKDDLSAEVLTDSIPEISDSLRHVLDSTHRADSIAARDSLDLLRKSSLESPAFTTARDSVI